MNRRAIKSHWIHGSIPWLETHAVPQGAKKSGQRFRWFPRRANPIVLSNETTKTRRTADDEGIKQEHGVNPPSPRKVFRWIVALGRHGHSSKSRVRHPDETPIMKHSHHHDNLRSAGLQLKQERSESTHPTARAVSSAGTSDEE